MFKFLRRLNVPGDRDHVEETFGFPYKYRLVYS